MLIFARIYPRSAIKIWLVHVRECPTVLRRRHFFYFFHKVKMAERIFTVLLFLVAFISVCSFANKVDEEESCRRYAGGQVYPERTTISEHAVHWSKAQSKISLVWLKIISLFVWKRACYHVCSDKFKQILFSLSLSFTTQYFVFGNRACRLKNWLFLVKSDPIAVKLVAMHITWSCLRCRLASCKIDSCKDKDFKANIFVYSVFKKYLTITAYCRVLMFAFICKPMNRNALARNIFWPKPFIVVLKLGWILELDEMVI